MKGSRCVAQTIGSRDLGTGEDSKMFLVSKHLYSADECPQH